MEELQEEYARIDAANHALFDKIHARMNLTATDGFTEAIACILGLVNGRRVTDVRRIPTPPTKSCHECHKVIRSSDCIRVSAHTKNFRYFQIFLHVQCYKIRTGDLMKLLEV